MQGKKVAFNLGAVRGLALAALAAAFTTAWAAPIVVQKGSIAGYVYIPGSSVAAAGGSTSGGSGSQNCYYSPITENTFTFTSLPASLFPLTVDYRMVGGGGGSAGNYGGGGGGGSSAILVNGTPVAVAAGGDGGSALVGQSNGADGLPGVVVTGSFTVQQSSTVRMVVGGGGGSTYNSVGYGYDYNSLYGHTYYYGGGGGGAGYFGGGGGGGRPDSSTAANGGKGGGTSGGLGGTGSASSGQAGSANTGGNGAGNLAKGTGGNGIVGGTSQAQYSSGSGTSCSPCQSFSYTTSVTGAGAGGGFGSSGGFPAWSGSGQGYWQINAGSSGFQAQRPTANVAAASYVSFGSMDYRSGGIASLALFPFAGAPGSVSNMRVAAPGQIVVRYSSPACNVF